MKTFILVLAAILSASGIILFGVLSWAFDSWLWGLITGLALSAYPAWVRESFKKRQDG